MEGQSVSRFNMILQKSPNSTQPAIGTATTQTVILNHVDTWVPAALDLLLQPAATRDPGLDTDLVTGLCDELDTRTDPAAGEGDPEALRSG